MVYERSCTRVLGPKTCRAAAGLEDHQHASDGGALAAMTDEEAAELYAHWHPRLAQMKGADAAKLLEAVRRAPAFAAPPRTAAYAAIRAYVFDEGGGNPRSALGPADGGLPAMVAALCCAPDPNDGEAAAVAVVATTTSPTLRAVYTGLYASLAGVAAARLRSGRCARRLAGDPDVAEEVEATLQELARLRLTDLGFSPGSAAAWEGLARALSGLARHYMDCFPRWRGALGGMPAAGE